MLWRGPAFLQEPSPFSSPTSRARRGSCTSSESGTRTCWPTTGALREAFERHGGVEVDTQGDAFFVAFSRASDAVAGARAAQDALRGGPVRVRMGLHTGEPALGEEGYVGIDVHRAARVAAAGHGGQVLLSQPTRDLLDSSFELVELGLHRLKDLSEPQLLYQLGTEDRR